VVLAHLYAQSRAIFHYGNSIKGIPLFAWCCMPPPPPILPTVYAREIGRGVGTEKILTIFRMALFLCLVEKSKFSRFLCHKTIPMTGRGGPWGYETSRLPRLTDGGEVVSLTSRPPLTPRKIPSTHFCWRLLCTTSVSFLCDIIHCYVVLELVINCIRNNGGVF
jgi:hypothetical protein